MSYVFNIFTGTLDYFVPQSTGSLTTLATASTIDDTNLAFVFASKPTQVFVNGIGYRENHGWSWTAGTLTATLDNPVGSGGDIYATI